MCHTQRAFPTHGDGSDEFDFTEEGYGDSKAPVPLASEREETQRIIS